MVQATPPHVGKTGEHGTCGPDMRNSPNDIISLLNVQVSRGEACCTMWNATGKGNWSIQEKPSKENSLEGWVAALAAS